MIIIVCKFDVILSVPDHPDSNPDQLYVCGHVRILHSSQSESCINFSVTIFMRLLLLFSWGSYLESSSLSSLTFLITIGMARSLGISSFSSSCPLCFLRTATTFARGNSFKTFSTLTCMELWAPSSTFSLWSALSTLSMPMVPVLSPRSHQVHQQLRGLSQNLADTRHGQLSMLH